MFNRSEILTSAWAAYNRHRYLIPGQPRPFDRAEFNWQLRCAWARAKAEAMTPIERRINQIKQDIARLPYAVARTNIAHREAELRKELAALAAQLDIHHKEHRNDEDNASSGWRSYADQPNK